MSESIRLRFTLVIEYDANPKHYEGANGDPKVMAALDMDSIKTGYLNPYDFGEPTVETIEEVTPAHQP